MSIEVEWDVRDSVKEPHGLSVAPRPSATWAVLVTPLPHHPPCQLFLTGYFKNKCKCLVISPYILRYELRQIGVCACVCVRKIMTLLSQSFCGNIYAQAMFSFPGFYLIVGLFISKSKMSLRIPFDRGTSVFCSPGLLSVPLSLSCATHLLEELTRVL